MTIEQAREYLRSHLQPKTDEEVRLFYTALEIVSKGE